MTLNQFCVSVRTFILMLIQTVESWIDIDRMFIQHCDRAPDKRGIEDNSKLFFSNFSMKTYVVTPH